MTITTCPHCQMRILPRPDGTCPSCNSLVAQTEAPPPSKPSGAVVKRAAKPSERRKTAPKAGRSRPPAATSSREIEGVYREYHQTAKDVRTGSVRVLYRYLLAGIAIGVVSILISFLAWNQVLSGLTLVRQPSTASWVLIWFGIVVILGSLVLGAIKGEERGKARVRDIAQEWGGFPDFYKRYQKRYWPKDGMPAGPVYDKFLTILGK